MISKISINRQILHFRTPFQITYESVNTAEVIIIQIVDENGNIGFGSASPDTEVTEETVDGVFEVLNQRLTKDFFEYDLNSWYPYHEKIQQTFAGFPSAQAAVEEVYLNLWSQIHKIPLTRFFGGYRNSCNTMITIGIQPLKEAIKEVKKRLEEGFRVIKLKCGLDVIGDLERIREVNKMIPKNVELVLDANQGYSLDEAKKMIKELKEYGTQTPLEFTGLRENAKLLLNFGVEAENVLPYLKMLGDISGGNAEKLNSLTLAFA